MGALASIILGIISYLPQAPGLISAVEALIARGKASGELSAEEEAAMLNMAQVLFVKYSQAAPPPPGA